ncbi:TolB family protein [Desulfosediminicola ganghwensis]|uniref:TolB family protein n=1 Tax=Desulfosediminicola ganghwensis TaxID=2569540 RepID=UPI0010AC9F49|nr:hypothetical protein [Desulfosediminicola ganghwensis]
MEKLFSILLMTTIVVTTAIFHVHAQDYKTTRITNSEYYNAYPQINDNGVIVWEGTDKSSPYEKDIFTYDGSLITKITNINFNDEKPLINNSGDIVWRASELPLTSSNFCNRHIFLYDGYTIIQLDSDDYLNWNEHYRINDSGNVTWSSMIGIYRIPNECSIQSDFAQIFLYKDSETKQVTQEPYPYAGHLRPDINNLNQIVWDMPTKGGSLFYLFGDIYIYNSTIISQISKNSYKDWRAVINDKGHVAWSGYDGNDFEIYFYDGSSIIQVTDNDYDDPCSFYGYNLKINNSGQIVWSAYNGSGWEIFFYSGSSVIQITDNDDYDKDPQINDKGHIVWSTTLADAPNNSEIFLYNGSTTTQLTDNGGSNQYPQINNNGEIVWVGPDDDGLGGEIFHAVPSPTTINVAIDIKPGSDPNSINIKNKITIPVAILSSVEFDAITIVPETITLSIEEVTLKVIEKKSNYLCNSDDANADGLLDLLCQVQTTDANIDSGELIAVLEAETEEGLLIHGEDLVRIVP